MADQPGDILLVRDRAGLVAVGQGVAQFFKYLTVAPLLISIGRNGGAKGAAIWNAGYVHAAIFVSPQQGWAHSTNAGTLSGDNTFPQTGDLVFRCGDKKKAAVAAQVGKTWATGDAAGKWKLGKAMRSAVGSSSYGDDAKKHAAFYRANRNTKNGPPNQNWFCSMFVIACWQAALDNDAETQQLMKLDAPYSTPMTLVTYLENSPLYWTKRVQA
jgi:hypothetical protein